jgi:plastocyanin
MSFRPQYVHARRPGRVVLSFAALAAAAVIAAPAQAGDHSITVVNSAFLPSNLTIQAGDSVTWTKAATTLPHNAVFPAEGNLRCADGCENAGGNGNLMTEPWTFTRTFSTPGQISYVCQLHGPAMGGTITVEGPGPQPGALRFSNASFSRNEGGGSATITVQRVNGDDGPVSVQYATGGGTATANSDYTPSNGTLNWPDNDDNPKTFTVPILEDTADEPNETVGLFLSNPTGGAVLGSPSTANLTIVDNDDSGPAPSAGSLRFSTGAQSVQESAGPATAVVQRTDGSAGIVSVQYDSADGTATGGDDYTPVSGILSWGGGDAANKSFQVPILDDGDTEDAETLILMLSAPSGGATVGTPASQTITVLDDDGVDPGPCIEGDHTLCLLSERFRVEVVFTPPGGVEQPANAIPFTDRAGMYWFFNPNNIEMLVKLQNACIPQFDRYWVFFAATTNVEFRVTVTDTDALRVKRYSNPQGMVALPVADTQAFATCP